MIEPETGSEQVSPEWLGALPVFNHLPPALVGSIAAQAQPRRYRPGEQVVVQGEKADRMGIVIAGGAEVTISTPGGMVPVATLGPGDIFGETGLLSADGVRTATVTALAEVRTVELTRAETQELLARSSDLRQSLEGLAQLSARSNLLRAASPFGTLDPGQARELACRIRTVTFGADDDIVRQGEEGESCFVLQSGSAVVILTGEHGERVVDRIKPGDLFGEAALLSAQPRSATVRAAENCVLLEISRTDLLDAIGGQPGQDLLIKVMRMRERPVRRPGVTENHRQSPDGSNITVLKDHGRRTYYRLSDLGYFVWSQLDGTHNLREIAVEYYQQTGLLAPFAIAETIAGLVQAGFVERAPVIVKAVDGHPRPLWLRAARRAKRVLEFQAGITGVDPFWTFLYRSIGRWFFTLPGKTATALVAAIGLVAFVRATPSASATLGEPVRGWLLLFLPLAYIAAIAAHEGGHALATKHYGREVDRMGIGWYWFGPIAFIDTSDMWLADRRQRIWTSVAGPYADLFLAGLAAIASLMVTSPALATICWQFALASYIAVFINLNPLLELDGYYVLSDWLDRPNLRPKALAWIGRAFPKVLSHPDEMKKRRIELAYGLAAVVYVPLAAVLTLFVYRNLVQVWIARWAPAGTADILAWVVVTAGVGFSILALAGELRGANEPAA